MTPSLMDERSIKLYYFSLREVSEITKRSESFIRERLMDGDIEYEMYDGELMIKPDQLDKIRC